MPKARSTQGCGPRACCAGGGDRGARLGFEPGPLVEPDGEGELIQGPGKTLSFRSLPTATLASVKLGPMSYCRVPTIAHAGFMQADLVERRVSSPKQTHVISCERRSLYVCHGLMS